MSLLLFFSSHGPTYADHYYVTINGVDRTADILNLTPYVEDILNDQQNTCTLKLIDRSGLGIPETDEEIIIYLEDQPILFGGYIIKTDLQQREYGEVTANLTCVDYSRLLDRNLVHEGYQDMTDKEIIEDIIETYCPGFGITTDHVTEGVTISQITFNYMQPSQCLKKICELTGRNWFIDYDKDIHYFPMDTNVAPFNITDGTNVDNLKISKDATQIKNRVYVRGGTYLSDFTTYSEKGDSSKRKFVLPDKPHNVTVTVNGVSKSVGIKNVNLSGYDWYLNFQEKYIEQDSGAVILSNTDVLTVTYKYDIPILVAVEDTASIIESGIHEFAIFDKTISTTTSARDRAQAELTDYANDLIEASFETYEPGFRSGQYVNIDREDFNVDANYIVQQVTARAYGAGIYKYTISLASAKTMGIIKFLIELLEANRNLIELDPNETVDELFLVSDSLLSDSLTDNLTIDSSGPYFTWCTDSLQSTPITRARWNLFQWG